MHTLIISLETEAACHSTQRTSSWVANATFEVRGIRPKVYGIVVHDWIRLRYLLVPPDACYGAQCNA
jgi:hypothetical protein